jgi:hypothetical protein
MAADLHVWAIRTDEYQQIAELLPGRTPERGVTLFGAGEAHPEQEAISILGTVEEHHGEWSHRPPLDVLEVLGAEPTPDVRAALSDLGFTEVAPRTGGFVASRRNALLSFSAPDR